MRKKNSFYLALVLLVSLSGCALLTRDVYFKEANSDYKKNYQEMFAGSEAVESYTSAGYGDKPSDQLPKKVHVSVVNKESITYLAGIIVPIIPVFFWSGSKSYFDPEEKLRISCHFVPDYRDEVVSGDFDHEAKMKGFPECGTLQVVLNDGRKLDPVHESKRVGQGFGKFELIISEFEFDVKVASVKSIRIENIVAKQNGMATNQLNTRFNFVFEDWTRYLMPRMN